MAFDTLSTPILWATPTDPIKDNVKMSKPPNVSVYFDNGVKWIQIGKLPGGWRSHDNLSQRNWVEIRIQFSSGCCCLIVKQWGLMTSSEDLQFPHQMTTSSLTLPSLALPLPVSPPLEASLTAWSERKCLTTAWESYPPSTCQEGRKWEPCWRLASGKTHQPSQSSHHRVSRLELELNTNTGCESFVSQKPWKAP